MQSGAKSGVGPRQRTSFPRTRCKAAQSNFPNWPMARQESSEEAPCVIFFHHPRSLPMAHGLCWSSSASPGKQAGKDPSEAGNALVLADTRERSKTVTKSKLVASSAIDPRTNGIAERAVRRV